MEDTLCQAGRFGITSVVADNIADHQRRMEVRLKSTEKVKPKQKKAGKFMIGVLLAVVGGAVWFAIPKKQAPPGSLRFYSDDDGVTWFVDDATKLPPYQHSGKEAVIARVYETSGGKQFVAWLEKYTDEEKQTLEAKTHGPPPKPGVATLKIGASHHSGLLVKKPRDGKWVAAEDEAGRDIETATSPDGGTNCVPVLPE